MIRSLCIKSSLLFVFFACNQFSAFSNNILKDTTDGKAIILNFWNQTMFRYYDLNPGTLINDAPVDEIFDIGIRRMRISGDIRVNNNTKIFIQAGINNQSFMAGGGTGTGGNGFGKKPAIFFHDAYSEMKLINKQGKKNPINKYTMHVGAGLHSWTGVSRLSNASSNKILAIDFPLFNFPTLERSDQFGRQLGVFTHGNMAKLNYRFSINKPFATNVNPTTLNVAVDASSPKTLAKSGYLYYQFKEIENNSNAFLSGTYLGDKEILNIGGGFYFANDATKSLNKNEQIIAHNNQVLGFDIFYDKPFSINNKKTNLTIYSVWYYYNYGPNYTRLAGVMNPGSINRDASIIAFEGAGNNSINLGTGNILYTQTAWVLPSNKPIKIQPFITYAYKDLQALSKIGHFYDIGSHLLINKHQTKVSLQYSNKPLYTVNAQQILKRTNEITACFQVLF